MVDGEGVQVKEENRGGQVLYYVTCSNDVDSANHATPHSEDGFDNFRVVLPVALRGND